jgi:PleD family two-component response regulator
MKITHDASGVAPVVTVSVGGTDDSSGRSSLEELFRSADAALYRAKAERNAVCFAEPSVEWQPPVPLQPLIAT